jgi:SAM-dependent methyltransferase
MSEIDRNDAWSSGSAYEDFIGRWSRQVASTFLGWLAAPRGATWLDVGCGAGALCEAILASQEPSSVRGIDPSPEFVAFARERVADPRATFDVGRAEAIDAPPCAYDAVVSGLVLNFVPDPAAAVHEFARVTRSGGAVGVYVWDYAEGMQMLRLFWDAATAIDPDAAHLDEARRFPICQPDRLHDLFEGGGLTRVEHRAIDVATHWLDFEAFWRPFLGRTGPVPSYVASLSDERRTQLRERLRAMLPSASDGSIRLVARAWAVKARVS